MDPLQVVQLLKQQGLKVGTVTEGDEEEYDAEIEVNGYSLQVGANYFNLWKYKYNSFGTVVEGTIVLQDAMLEDIVTFLKGKLH
jgi:hypothetical protein